MWLFNKRKRDIYGSASFLGFWQERRLLSKKYDGLVIDGKRKISLENSFKHCAIVAPTGTGKTTRFIIPNILSAKEHSMVVTDPSGEIHTICKNYLLETGYIIKTLNVSDLSKTDFYNPLSRLKNFTDIQKLASILVDANLKSNHSDPFWNDSAKAILSVFIRYLKTLDINYQTLFNLYTLLHQFSTAREELNLQMAKSLNSATFLEYKSFVSQEEKIISGILSTAKTALSKMSDPKLAEITSKDSLDFSDLRRNKTTLFIIVPEHEIEHYSFLLTVFYSQLFDFCMTLPSLHTPYLPIFFLLDEFGNLGELPNFATLMTTLRKRKCSVSLVLQDTEQLNEVYGKSGASTILYGGCASSIYFPGVSQSTCEALERILGKQTLLHKKEELSAWDLPTSNDIQKAQEIGRPLMTADEIRTMKDNQALFIHANKRPVKLNTLPWYNSKKMLRKAN